MIDDDYVGYDKVLKDALVSRRGGGADSSKADRIRALEQKLETAKLSTAEIAELQKQLKQLRSN